jgi:hypothetical protein
MPTQCSRDLFGYEVVEGRQVVAAFDGGDNTSDAGALLLGATAPKHPIAPPAPFRPPHGRPHLPPVRNPGYPWGDPRIRRSGAAPLVSAQRVTVRRIPTARPAGHRGRDKTSSG